MSNPEVDVPQQPGYYGRVMDRVTNRANKGFKRTSVHIKLGESELMYWRKLAGSAEHALFDPTLEACTPSPLMNQPACAWLTAIYPATLETLSADTPGGQDLRQRFPVGLAAVIAALDDGLTVMHGLQLTHGDISFANIFVTSDCAIVIGNSGLMQNLGTSSPAGSAPTSPLHQMLFPIHPILPDRFRINKTRNQLKKWYKLADFSAAGLVIMGLSVAPLIFSFGQEDRFRTLDPIADIINNPKVPLFLANLENIVTDWSYNADDISREFKRLQQWFSKSGDVKIGIPRH